MRSGLTFATPWLVHSAAFCVAGRACKIQSGPKIAFLKLIWDSTGRRIRRRSTPDRILADQIAAAFGARGLRLAHPDRLIPGVGDMMY
jgi:hypothetical protein